MAIDRDASLDGYIALQETGVVRGVTTDPMAMRDEHNVLVDAGLLDLDEPTPWSHYAYRQRWTADFTPEERWMIRLHLGLGQERDES